MKSDPMNKQMPSKPARRKAPPSLHPGVDAMPEPTPSPAAMDEVFAMMSRNLDRLQQVSSEARRLAPGNPTAQTPATEMPADSTEMENTPSTLQPSAMTEQEATAMDELADDMERQHERLMQLLRGVIA